ARWVSIARSPRIVRSRTAPDRDGGSVSSRTRFTTGVVRVVAACLEAARLRSAAWVASPESERMADTPFIARGFRSRRAPVSPGRLPPGQYETRDFPVLSAGPTPHTPLANWDFT